MSVPSWKRSLNRLDSTIRRTVSGESDEAFLAGLYGEMLGRTPDAGALSAGTRGLSLGLQRRGHVRRSIASSAEYQALTSARETPRVVRESYRALLGRGPSEAEEWNGVQLVAAARHGRAGLEREIRAGIEYWLGHSPAPATNRSLAASLPEEIWLELTTRCNMVPACAMCGYAGADPPGGRRDMEAATWLALLPLLRQARVVGLHGAGEPLLYPFLDDLLLALQTSSAVVGFNTNGHLLTEATCRRLVEHGLGWISISLDAATARTYLRIRRRRDFERLLSKIERLREIRDAQGSARPQVEINMTVMRLNLEEAPDFVELASRLGVDRVMFQEIQPGGSQRVVSPDGFLFDYREQELAGESRRDELLGQARERARSLGLSFSSELLYGSPAFEAASKAPERPEGSSAVSAAPASAEPWRRLLFDAEGGAFVCCIQMTNGVLLGRLPHDSPERIWNGRRARLVREAMFGGPAPPCCRGCYRTSGVGEGIVRPAGPSSAST